MGARSSELAGQESQLLDRWIRPALESGIEARFERPPAEPGGEVRVFLTLLGIEPAPAPRAARGLAPLRLTVRFLVSVGGPASEAAVVLSELAFAALRDGAPEIEADSPSAELWLALGIHARPAIIVRALLTRERPERRVPFVRQPLVTKWATGASLRGRVVGPGDLAIAGALIELEASGAIAHSDHRGEFILSPVPAGPPVPMLRVSAKGTRVTCPAEPPPDTDLLVIRVPLPE